jgi:GGDEF domain-containing protein
MVYENQTELIRDNAILNSKVRASNLKYGMDNILKNDGSLSREHINQILKEADKLSINTITLFDENGRVYVSIKDGTRIKKSKANIEELKMINMAITKRTFGNKLFYHKVNRKDKTIGLYIPFTFSKNNTGVAFIRLFMGDITKAMKNLLKQSILIAIVIIIIHSVFAMVLAKMILLPIRQLNEATMSISHGDLDIRVPIVRTDEIGQLSSSFNEMSIALKRMRDEAKGANPLTGLPGNLAIARFINSSLDKGKIICVLYCDLDNFKAYNDKYGFTKGDEAILYTRDCLVSVAKRNDMKNIFLGHEGGDDFVVICDFEYWEQFAKAFTTTFDRGIYQFYNSTDARNGFIESVNRQGERQRFPLMSISVAVVTNKYRPFSKHAEMVQVAAEVKKFIKKQDSDGSKYAIDRRKGPISQADQEETQNPE